MRPDVWFVYVALCADDTLYTGIARDVARRLAEHDGPRGARYTRGRGPLALVASRRCRSRAEALRLELAVKALPRARKAALAAPRDFAKLSRAVEKRALARPRSADR